MNEQEVVKVERESSDAIVFLTLKWQRDNQMAGQLIEQLRDDLAGSRGLLKNAREDAKYFQDKLTDLSQMGGLEHRLRRLSHDRLMDFLWWCFGPHQDEPPAKIDAIKYLRIAEGVGLLDAKKTIDKDWAHRDLNGNLDSGGETTEELAKDNAYNA